MKPLLLIALLAPAALSAQTSESRPLPVAPDTGKATLTVECFSGPSVPIPTAFIADPQAPRQWFADAYLDGGKLGAPLVKAIPFSHGRAGASPYLTNGWFVLSLPNAAPAEPIVVRLILSAGAADTERKTLGSILVRITPRDFLRQAFTSRLGEPARPLDIIVFGPEPGPRELLAAWQIPFLDHGPNPPGNAPPGALLLGESADLGHLPAPTPGASAFVLTSDSRLDADSEIRDFGGARFTFVRAAATDWKNDPRLHRLLAAHLSSR